MKQYHHPLDPTIVNPHDRTPSFFKEKLVGIVCDINGKEHPVTITFWKSETKIEEVCYVCPDADYGNDLENDIYSLLSKEYRGVEIDERFERIYPKTTFYYRFVNGQFCEATSLDEARAKLSISEQVRVSTITRVGYSE